eukprot:CAMPEP_0172547890 /NCGR_PEP_ID=MMETSP1067-20121228/17316_1 /TAXON_ID=265564 ORGANISM="Thalassiosira punctigera, Strain Tpunct2005C2" /NCGR_SAMPLE_ID=MMETSP1067 /ASSEMBLY_ACC=CAM_ASM_000444 /LENGTH=529 /DNA_ID=CAMNT_0013335039 /DNA_START=86 /DNA_END=1675 /DNA_ORIENTATION=+
MSFLKQKRSVEDIWPIYNKNVLVRVDFNVPVRNGVIAKSKDGRIRAAIPTIRRIVDQGGKAILMSHMGRPTGHKYAALRSSDEKRRRYVQIWNDEAGAGYTTFFAVLDGEAKKTIMSWSSRVSERSSELSEKEGAGKTDLFSSLPNEEKRTLLKRFRSDERSRASFPQLRQYGGFDDELTLRPVAARLSKLLNSGSGPRVEVNFAEDCLDADDIVARMEPGQVLLLENLRFYSDENSRDESERTTMARKIASYGDYLVSEAFGTSHRKNSATMVNLPMVLGHGCCGYLMQKEITAYAKLLGGAPRPMVAIVGGAKVSDKINLLLNILSQIDYLAVGGAMAYTFLKAAGFHIGNSFHETGQSFGDKYGEAQNIDDLAKRFLIKAKACNVEVLLPVDHLCHTSCDPTDDPLITETAHVPDGYMALDIGPRTVESYRRCVSRCKTAVWSGPMGVFEIPTYATGSFSIAKAMGDGTRESGLLSIIGGGASADAAQRCGHATRVSHVSSGGGASLDLLEGKVPPSINALDDKHA